MICLLAVFPCGAALTVLGTIAAEAVRAFASHDQVSQKLVLLWMPTVWAGSGVAGFISLIYGVDKLMITPQRLPWYVILGILLGIAAAGFFSLTYPLRSSSALFLRIVCVAPVAIELLLLLYHLYRFTRSQPLPDETASPMAASVATSSPQESREP